MDELIEQLQQTLTQIIHAIATIERASIAKGILPYELQYPNGEFCLSPLLVAKANTLIALTTLEANRG